MTGKQGFCIWITGLPSSGKSSITRILSAHVRAKGLPLVVLESDVMRAIFTPQPSYSLEERDYFYTALASLGALITQDGINVIIDATANRRRYRDHARSLMQRFTEIYVQCPLAICMQRDPKGIYHNAAAGRSGTVPGMQEPYEPPLNAEIVLDCQEEPGRNANVILDKLHQLLYI